MSDDGNGDAGTVGGHRWYPGAGWTGVRRDWIREVDPFNGRALRA